jgi:CelD/BcsL family acetyltransferase involved in cellulose biosynthesis
MSLPSLSDPPVGTGVSSPDYVLEERAWWDLSGADLTAWRRLAAQAVDPNPFYQPEFLLPALRWLEPDPQQVRLLVLRERGSLRWSFAAPFRTLLPTVKRPLARLRAYVSRHSFCDLPLIDCRDSQRAAAVFLNGMTDHAAWHGMRFLLIDREGVWARSLLEAGAKEGRCVWYDRVWNRACLDGNPTLPADLLHACSKSRRKSLQRAYRRLMDHGPVAFRLRRPAPDETEPVETFLTLEDNGWKHERGTSLRSRESDLRFLRAVARHFSAEGKLLFGELCVGGRVIASTCNFLAGNTLFAFKIGWDPTYRDGSPGTWSELLLAEQVRQELPAVQRLDSCASAGSYVESVWPHHRRMAGMCLTWSRCGVALARVRERLRLWKHLLSQHEVFWPELLGTGELDWHMA